MDSNQRSAQSASPPHLEWRPISQGVLRKIRTRGNYENQSDPWRYQLPLLYEVALWSLELFLSVFIFSPRIISPAVLPNLQQWLNR